METLKIQLFGTVELRRGARLVPPLPTQKSRALLCFLLLNRDRLHRRELLSDMLWPSRDEQTARQCLRTELWRVHSALEGRSRVPRGRYLTVDGRQVGFNADGDYWLDVAEFDRQLDRLRDCKSVPLPADRYHDLTSAIGLYRADLLEEVDYEWCLLERQRLKARVIGALEKLLRHYEARREWEAAVRTCYRLLGHDSLLEPVHATLMRCFHLMGNRGAALRQFEVCRELLKRELDVEPMVETIALYRRIKAGDEGDGDAAAPAPERDGPEPAEPSPPDPVEQIRRVLAELETTKSQIDDARVRLLRAIDGLEPSVRAAAPRSAKPLVPSAGPVRGRGLADGPSRR